MSRLFALVLLGTLGTGCVGATVRAPFAHDPFTAEATPPPVDLYAIDWWKRLVPPQFWEYGPRERAQPAIDADGNRVIAATRNGMVSAFTLRGALVWTVKTSSTFEAGPSIAKGVVYVPGGDGVLRALDERTGKALWTYEAVGPIGTSPVRAGDEVLVATLGDVLIAVNAADGKWVWQYRRDVPSGFTIHGTGAPLVQGGVVYHGFSDGHLVALKLADGAVLWDRALSTASQFADADATPRIDGAGRLIAASYQNGLYGLKPETGEIEWHTAAPGITHLLVRDEVAFATGAKGASTYSTRTGQRVWSTPLDASAGFSPGLAGGHLLVPSADALYFLDPATGAIELDFDPGEGITAPVGTVGSRIYVLSNLGFLYAMELR